jgi:hypothetical protein
MARIFAGSIRVDWRDSRLNFLSEECWTETGWQNKVASVKREVNSAITNATTPLKN